MCIIYHRKALELNFSIKLCPPGFDLWVPLHEHVYLFVFPCFLKAHTFLEKVSSRAFQPYRTLLYYMCIIYCRKALELNFSIKLFSTWF